MKFLHNTAMNKNNSVVKRALISVSDKTGIVQFAQFLHQHGVEILSTDGTARMLKDALIPVRDVSQYTAFPEIMDGRVKTLHPRIHGGILGRRDSDTAIALQHGIEWIDLVVCNLYPFEITASNVSATEELIRDQIDIGGPTLLRSAAKNYEWVCVIVDPEDYAMITNEIVQSGISFETRKQLAVKAFAHTSCYDAVIANHFHTELFPAALPFALYKQLDLRYGENPHQRACYYSLGNSQRTLPFSIHQGKQLSYNNFLDADAAWRCVQEFTQTACVIVKHGNPCGAGLGLTAEEVYEKALASDPLSAFGGIVAFNVPVSKALAELLIQTFYEVVIAPGYDPASREVLEKKKNLRVLELNVKNFSSREFRTVFGNVLTQESDASCITADTLSCVTRIAPTAQQINDMLFAWSIVKHVKSNAIVLAKNEQVIGIGSGHVSRIDAVECALRKASSKTKGSVLASDAFFPFRDSIDRIAQVEITSIIQPGGSVKDQEVIDACDQYNLPMVFTGIRAFKH